MKNIKIGYDRNQKTAVIQKYLAEHPEIDKVVYFTADKREPLKIDHLNVEYRTWSDAIMYRYFYPLLEKIDHHTLLIFDEMMRTRKRNDLTYNCCHHYGNQTEHILVFNWLPMIDEPEDFMILLDFAFPYTFKGQPYAPEMLAMDGVEVVDRMVRMEQFRLDIAPDVKEEYDAEKEMLFDSIGTKDPDTIPRTLHVWAGTHCKKSVHSDNPCVARNGRYKKQASAIYGKECPEADAYTILDFPVRVLQFVDFLETTGVKRLTFVNSTLSADELYWQAYNGWTERLGGMYVAASVC